VIRINSNTDEKKTVLDALKGEYGTNTQPNGLCVTHSGRLVLLWGAFSKGADAVEIPKIPVRFPVLFSGDDSACSVPVEPNAGFVSVPEAFKTKRFMVMGFALLNDQ
jgi:hypothetical protein